MAILECTHIATGQGCEQPDALSQLVMLSVGGVGCDPVSILGRGLSSAPLPPSTYYKADYKPRILVPTGFLPGQSKQTCHG